MQKHLKPSQKKNKHFKNYKHQDSLHTYEDNHASLQNAKEKKSNSHQQILKKTQQTSKAY
jgi:hypothetical protein